MKFKCRQISEACLSKMCVLRLNKLYFGFTAVFHFMAHATTAFFYCCITDGGRLELITAIELLNTYPKTGSSINAEQYD